MASFKADTIYVSGLDSSISEEVLRNEVFSTAGTILSINMNYDRFGKSTGSATIRFQSVQQASKAAEWNKALVDGKEMTVQLVGSHVKPISIQKAATATPPPTTVRAVPVPNEHHPHSRQQPSRSLQRGAAPPIMAARQPHRDNAPPSQRSFPQSQHQQRRPPQQQRLPQQPHRSQQPLRAPRPAPKKVLSAADLDAQLDKYNAAREAHE